MQVEIDFAGHPLLVALGHQGRDEAQSGGAFGEDRSHPCGATRIGGDIDDLAVLRFDHSVEKNARDVRRTQQINRDNFVSVIRRVLHERLFAF